MSNLLSRYAEAIFWMARQIERVNNLARLLDVTESFGRDARGDQNWESVLRLYADLDVYRERGLEVGADAVIHFYVLDRENPNSVASNLHLARENARALRPLISTEMWAHLNLFYGDMRALTRRDVSEEKLSGLARWMKEACQLQAGVTAETLYRDEAWHFYEMGRYIERADQTTRLVDTKYELLLPAAAEVGSPVDRAQWNALLRSAAGFHAFRRIHPSGMNAEKVAGFLIFDERFPRSVAGCVRRAGEALDDLRTRYELEPGAAALEALNREHRRLRQDRIERVMADGLHEYLDAIQKQMIEATDLLSRDFFG